MPNVRGNSKIGNPKKLEVKVVLLGSSGVGKTSIAKRF